MLIWMKSAQPRAPLNPGLGSEFAHILRPIRDHHRTNAQYLLGAMNINCSICMPLTTLSLSFPPLVHSYFSAGASELVAIYAIEAVCFLCRWFEMAILFMGLHVSPLTAAIVDQKYTSTNDL